MNLNYLGDSMDFWKGAVFVRLQEGGILEDFAVDPMLTDAKDWHTADFHLYADLLQIRPNQILRHKSTLSEYRKRYFDEIRHAGDLYVDPDTGIAPKHAGPAENYVRIGEIHKLLNSPSTRVLCVYQHVRAKKTRARVIELFAALRELNANIYSCSYESPNVAMLFLSLEQNRINQMKKYFRNYLGRHSDGRVLSY